MNRKHIFQKVNGRGCYNDKENKKWDSLVKETQETVKTIADWNLHKSHQFGSLKTVLLVEGKTFVSGKHIDADWESSQTTWYYIGYCKNFALCLDITQVSSSIVSFSPSFEFLQVQKLLKNQDDRHDKTGWEYFENLLDFWLDEVFDIEDVKGAIDVESTVVSLEIAEILETGEVFGPVDADTNDD